MTGRPRKKARLATKLTTKARTDTRFAVIRRDSFSNSGVKMAVEILRLMEREMKPSVGLERF
jgi:hypothetical protein